MTLRPTKYRDRAQLFHLGLMKSDNDLNADKPKERNDFYDRYSGYKSRFKKKSHLRLLISGFCELREEKAIPINH